MSVWKNIANALLLGACLMTLAGTGCSRALSDDAAARLQPGSLTAGAPAIGEGKKTCAACHAEQQRFWAYGGHVSIACAGCHEVDGDHVEGKTQPLLGGNDQCLGCHDLGKAGAEESMTEAEALEHHMKFLEKKHVIKVRRKKKKKKRCIQCHDPHLGQ